MRKNIVFSVLLGVFALLALAGVMSMNTSVQAASGDLPVALVTPVSATSRGTAANVLTLLDTTTLTAAANGPAVNVQNFEIADVQYVIDQGTVANTTTVKLQFSNDNVNWVDGNNIVAANVADAGDMQQFALFGRYARVAVSAGNSQPFSVKVIGLGK